MNKRNTFVLQEGGREEKAKLCVAKVLLLFRTKLRESREGGDSANFQYMECSPQHDNLDKVLEFVRRPWTTHDKRDYILEELSCLSVKDSLRA